MTRSMTRRAAMTAAAIGALGMVAAGCGSGPDAQTATQLPSIAGVNANAPDGSVAVRNALIVYPGPQGYAEGEDALVELVLVNQTTRPVRLVGAGTEAAGSVALADSTTGEPGGMGEPPAEPTDEEATDEEATDEQPTGEDPADGGDAPEEPVVTELEVPANGFVQATLRVSGLRMALDGTNNLPLTLVFESSEDDLSEVTLEVPMATPVLPEPRATAPADDH